LDTSSSSSLCVYVGIHPEIKSCSNLGAVLDLNDPISGLVLVAAGVMATVTVWTSGCCLPRHRVACNSTDEGSKRVG